MDPHGHQSSDKENVGDKDSLNDIADNVPVRFAKLSAIYFYLNELQKRNLITPSISRPYPCLPITNEKLVVHSAYRKVQQNRINNMRDEIKDFRDRKVSLCFKTLQYM